MIRKAIIVVSATLAVAILLLAVGSYWWPIYWDLSRTPTPRRDPDLGRVYPSGPGEVAGRWLYLVLTDGQATLTYASRETGPPLFFRPPAKGLKREEINKALEPSHSYVAFVDSRLKLEYEWLDARKKCVEGSGDLAGTDETYRQRVHALRREGAHVLMRALAGEHFAFQYHGAPKAELILRFPLWLLVIVFGLYPCLAFWRGPVRRYHRRKRGLCVHCGYNLTALTEPRCPECGNAI